MRTLTITKDVYEFSELSDSAKETARQWYREASAYDQWWDFIYEDAVRIGEIIGLTIDLKKIYFDIGRGGYCQIVGSYEYVKGNVAAIKAECPMDDELHRIARELAKLNRKYFYALSANFRTSGSRGYSSEFATYVDNDQYLADEDEDTLRQLIRDFSEWILDNLRAEEEYLRSDEHVDETIICNEYEFTASGERV